MKTTSAFVAALIMGAMLAGCAATGSRMTTTTATYKDMSASQRWWCDSFGSTCGCTIDGMKTTCSLAQACVSSGNCKVAQ